MIKTAIVYYSKHHGNTKKLVDATSLRHDITLINSADNKTADLLDFDCIGFASGIYFASFAKQVLTFAENNLPENKNVFFISTCGFRCPIIYFGKIRKITKSKGCPELGAYQFLGHDTFGPFKSLGGIAKGHPNEKDTIGAIKFYEKIIESATNR